MRKNVNKQLYRAWLNAKTRCFNSRTWYYRYYGGRGVVMCEGWRTSFDAFAADVGEPPEPGLTLDRIEVNGHYSCGRCPQCVERGWPFNVRWATKAEQQLNTRRVRRAA